MRILDRYVLRSHLGPFLFGFCIITGVLFVQILKNFLDEFLAKGISTFTIAEVLLGGKDEASDQVRDVQVYVLQSGRNPDILVAPRGRLHFENGGNTLYVDLYDGELHSIPESAHPEEAAYRVTRFHEHTIVIH